MGGNVRSSWTVRSPLTSDQTAWLMVGIVFVQTGLLCGPTFNYSILLLSLQDEFHTSTTLTGWVGSVANALLCCASPLSALFNHRYGPRTTTLIGVTMYCGGYLLTSVVPALVYAYFTFGILVGVGTNLVFHAGCFLILCWFPDKNCSRASLLALLGSSTGVLVFAPLMNALIDAFGWRNAVRIIGGTNVVIGLGLAVLMVTPRYSAIKKPSAENANDIISETALVAAGDVTAGDVAAEAVAPTPSVDRSEADEALTSESRKQQLNISKEPLIRRLIKLLLVVDAWMWILCLLLGNLGWSFVIINYASFMENDLQFSSEQVSVSIIIFAVGEIIGKIVISVIGDHIPCLKLYVVSAGSVLGGVAAGMMILVETVPSMYALSFFMGFFRAGSYGMPFAAAMEVFGGYGADVVTTIVMVPWGVGLFIGAPIAGSLYDRTGNYVLSLLVIMAVFLCSAAVVLYIPIGRWYRRRRQGQLATGDASSKHSVRL